jgi:hypothetical protein
LYLRSVLTLKCRLESGSVIRAMDIATIRMDTAITRTDTTDHIDTMVITQALRTIGLTGTGFTVTTVIIITIATNLA